MSHQLTRVWIFYVLGFTLTLAAKLVKAIYLGKKEGKPAKKIVVEWFFEPTVNNGSSWIATIGGVWVVGSIYINRIVQFTGLTDIPVTSSIAFFIGSLLEVIIPNLIKWIVSKIPSGNEK